MAMFNSYVKLPEGTSFPFYPYDCVTVSMWCCPASGFHWFGCVSGGPRCSRSRSIKGSCFGRTPTISTCTAHTSKDVYTYVHPPCICICVCVCIYIYVCVCSLSLSRIHTYTYTLYNLYTHTYTHVLYYVYIYIYICVCIVYVCICICMCMCICISICVYVYESWFFIKCTVCLNQYQPSYSGGVFPANVSMGHRKTIQDGQAKRCGPLLWNDQSTSMH